MNDHTMGFVYVLSTPDGCYKIGSTRNPYERVKQLAICLPYELKEEFWFMCELGKEQVVEQLIHRHFADKRMNGEWFKLSLEDISWFYQNPLPIAVAASHSRCYAQDCLAVGHSDDCLMNDMLGLS